MSDKFRILISRLHVRTKTYQLEKVAEDIHRLLQLARMSEKELGEIIPLTDTLEASGFWGSLLDTTKVSSEISHRSARSIYAVIWSASQGIPSLSARNQAREYCDRVAVVCERHLTTHAAEIKTLPAPPKKATGYLRVVEN
jgi:hypothetical protein